MSDEPLQPFDNGCRDAQGRFSKGNPGGPGNPRARATATVRRVIAETVTDDDLREITGKLVEMAKGGDLAAIRELLDRLLGKSKQPIEVDQSEVSDAEINKQIEELLKQVPVFNAPVTARGAAV